MSDPRLVDMEPGGESTQYESIREFTIPPEKQTGQLGGIADFRAAVKGGQSHTKSEATALPVATDSPASDAENELAQKLGRGFIKPSKEDLDFDNAGDAEAAKARRQQGYGPGSGVGG
ncbi:hypothetical protein N7478_006620 [Penicillium angulare]|uniref:uncharacterized protein n=1 Tax=Penicillium angulare TaxID=116970 RepID=UPI002541B30C|nr:uncharacterized protein N7478_006620 [Penicillium angulare]KAJ5281248.1 hypothetical protein N7478_006620 [Penicillium angulare]